MLRYVFSEIVTTKRWVLNCNFFQQIDIGEETGPRTVVSGLVHYIPIEEMRDKHLVAVVRVIAACSISPCLTIC